MRQVASGPRPPPPSARTCFSLSTTELVRAVFMPAILDRLEADPRGLRDPDSTLTATGAPSYVARYTRPNEPSPSASPRTIASASNSQAAILPRSTRSRARALALSEAGPGGGGQPSGGAGGRASAPMGWSPGPPKGSIGIIPGVVSKGVGPAFLLRLSSTIAAAAPAHHAGQKVKKAPPLCSARGGQPTRAYR